MAKYPNLLNNFLKYVKVNTRSNPESETIPSDPKEVAFLEELKQDLIKLNLTDIHIQPQSGYVIGTIPSNTDKKVPVIGYLAHVDTADFNSENIDPKVHENYDGVSDLKLDQNNEWTLKPKEFPNLKNYSGQTLITSDGSTLLGADDKAGVADIMAMIEYYQQNPEIKHGEIRIGFGPDEEIGTGADHFDAKDFNAKYAYTVDGGPLGELEYETFNAAQAVIDIQGNDVHTAVAKNVLINAITISQEYDQSLPNERPENTDGRAGFYHLLKISGTPDHVKAVYLIRDHDRNIFEKRKTIMEEAAKKINTKFDNERIKVQIKDQYFNMREVLEKDMTPVNIAQTAMENLNISPKIEPVRGGTDGSKISFMGLPTPNLFAGGENMHSRYEYVSVQTMEKAVDLLIEINTINLKNH